MQSKYNTKKEKQKRKKRRKRIKMEGKEKQKKHQRRSKQSNKIQPNVCVFSTGIKRRHKSTKTDSPCCEFPKSMSSSTSSETTTAVEMLLTVRESGPTSTKT